MYQHLVVIMLIMLYFIYLCEPLICARPQIHYITNYIGNDQILLPEELSV